MNSQLGGPWHTRQGRGGDVPADPIIYCLEQNTDYAAFETFCVDLMASAGFAGIEPIGGTGDRGRDAVWSGRHGDSPVVFAFSSRADWDRKLYEDCKRIQECGHRVAKLVFVSSRPAQAQARDRAIAEVLGRFGWRLEIYDVRRIRAMLKGEQRLVLANHPSIFCAPWFDVHGGLLIDAARDTLVIDHLECDHAFAAWLSRRLELVGYKVWCHGMAPLVGENAHDTVGQLIATRALRYLPVLSAESIRDRSFLDRCARAASTSGLATLPCAATQVDVRTLGELARIESARFDGSWAEGLVDLLRTLKAKGVHPTIASETSRAMGSLYTVEPLVVKDEPEAIYANVFRATVPQAVAAFQLSEDVTDDRIDRARRCWAFARAHKRVLLAFESPPEGVCLPLLGRAPAHQYAWKSFRDEYDRKSTGVVKELVRRTLEVACAKAGLEWCNERKEYYVPRVETGPCKFRHVDGERRSATLTGYRSYGSGADKKRLLYHLTPRFIVDIDEERQVWVTLRLYVRLVWEGGDLVTGTTIGRRRKKVTRQWWNKEWLMRTLAMMHRISRGEDAIEVGRGREKVSVATAPLRLECPLSIDVVAMDTLGDFQTEFATLRGDQEEEYGSVHTNVGEVDADGQ